MLILASKLEVYTNDDIPTPHFELILGNIPICTLINGNHYV